MKIVTKALIKNSIVARLQINEPIKTIYTVTSRRINHGEYLKVDSCKFKRIHDFEYPGDTINSENNNHTKLKYEYSR